MRPLIKFEGKIKSETFYNYVCATKRDLFGVPKKRGGRWETSKQVFCKVRTDTGDELDMKKKLQERYFGNGYEKYEELKAARIALKRKEITKEDYDKVLDYEKVYGGVVIKEIYQDTYDKNMINFILRAQ